MTVTETYPPSLSTDPTDDELERFVEAFCLEPSDHRSLLWLYLGEDGVPLIPPIGLTDLPVEPDHDHVAVLTDRIAEVADWVGATAVMLVWQSADESLSALFDDQRWAAALESQLVPEGIVVHPPMRRTPVGTSRLVLAG